MPGVPIRLRPRFPTETEDGYESKLAEGEQLTQLEFQMVGNARDRAALEAQDIRTELTRLKALRPIPIFRSAKRIAEQRERLERRLKELEQPEELVPRGEERPPLWDGPR